MCHVLLALSCIKLSPHMCRRLSLSFPQHLDARRNKGRNIMIMIILSDRDQCPPLVYLLPKLMLFETFE